MPQFLHVNQMMASCRELGQSSTDTDMGVEEWGGRGRSSKSLQDMLCPGPISHLLVTGDTYLLCNRLQYPPQREGLLFETLECLAFSLLSAEMRTTPPASAKQPGLLVPAQLHPGGTS